MGKGDATAIRGRFVLKPIVKLLPVAFWKTFVLGVSQDVPKKHLSTLQGLNVAWLWYCSPAKLIAK
jgi:hypothetical protein